MNKGFGGSELLKLLLEHKRWRSLIVHYLSLPATARITHLVGLAQHLDQVIGLVGVGVREQGVGGARVIGSSGASNAMHVVLRVWRIIIVDHKLDIVNVWSRSFDLYSFHFEFENWRSVKRNVKNIESIQCMSKIGFFLNTQKLFNKNENLFLCV